jgi:catechol 2,3-dioxygenase-like lactoylglutathione lyase family enzyme
MALDLQRMAPLLQVFDMPTAIRFYRDVLGFELVAASGDGEQSDWVALRHGRVELMLNTAYEADGRPVAPDATRIASHADVGLFFGCPDVDGAYAHVVAKGVAADPPKVAPYGMKQLYVTDPDGYVLCFQWPATAGT